MSATGRKPGEGKRIEASSTVVPAGETEPEAAPRDSTAETFKRRLHRLALDVHDGPMQNLTVIGFSLGDLRRRVQSVVPVEHQDKIDPAMEQISEELVRVEAELRALIGALEHGAIRTIPLIEAIETEIAEFERRSPAEVDRQIDPDVRTETDSQRIALQSVTREALSNIAKHAAAHTVTVRLRGTSRTITLEIVDDGRGFSPEAAKNKPRRLGLGGMRERVELLGGKFEVASRPGGPTHITATLKAWRPSDAP
jgi:signal transduction histidine kinase